jgi:hypothetical protein
MLDQYREVWAADFEFTAAPGERPDVACLVAHELKSGRVLRLWRDQLGSSPPYSIDRDSLFIAFYASAEIGCHLALGWPVPARILDLFTEFRAISNGLPTVAGSGLLGALTQAGIDNIGAIEKKEMREMFIRGAPYTPEERVAGLDYCESDVLALKRLLLVMLPLIDLPRAQLRGRYMAAAAHMEHNGVPIDTGMLALLRDGWLHIQDQLIAAIDAQYGVYDGRTFKADRFADWLAANNIPWPRLESGRLDLEDDTFRQMARSHPAVAPLRELRSALSELRLNDLAVGKDGRNRTILSAFRARTSRNQPSNSKFIFGPAVWLRSLIKPPPGWGVAYIDWSQQEFGIAAALSGELPCRPRIPGDPIWHSPNKPAGAWGCDQGRLWTLNWLHKSACWLCSTAWKRESLALVDSQPPVVARGLLRPTTGLSHLLALVGCCGRSGHAAWNNWTVFAGRAGVRSQSGTPRNFLMQANGADAAHCLLPGTERGPGLRACS